MSETIKIYKSVYLLKEAYDNGPNLSYDGSYFPLTSYRERNDRKYGFEINILCFRYMVDVKKMHYIQTFHLSNILCKIVQFKIYLIQNELITPELYQDRAKTIMIFA